MKTAQAYQDGQNRIIMKIEVPMSILELAYEFVAWEMHEAVDKAKSMSKKDILQEIRNAIRIDGIERSGYAVGDNDLNDELDEVEKIFKERFKKEFPNG